jgi:CRISPR-associated protein Cmr5
MNKTKINNLIPDAINALKDTKIVENGKIESAFNGYISSFGASVIQTGLLASVAKFENHNSNTDSDRSKLMKAILYLLTGENKTENGALLKYVIENQENNPRLKSEIEEAAIALKLTMRIFEFENKEEQENK